LGNQQLSPDEGKAQRLRVEKNFRSGGIMLTIIEKQILKPCRLSVQEQNRII